MGFIIHFTKESLVNNHFPETLHLIGFASALMIILFLSILAYKKMAPRIGENI
jgi:ABC-type polysaccharide/polyol phosphate export permease